MPTSTAPPTRVAGSVGRRLRTARQAVATLGVVVRTDDGDRPLTPEERERYLTDARAWRRGGTLRELGGLMADWLEGSILYQPGYGATCPDPETRELVPALAAANRAGFLTISSQPGHPPRIGYDGWLWTQLAAVTAFCSEATARSLCDYLAVRHAGFCAYTLPPPGSGRRTLRKTVWVTRREHPETGEEQWVTVFGARLSRRAVRSIYRGRVGSAAVTALENSWQVTLAAYDHERNDLWPTLHAWAQQHKAEHAPTAAS